MKGADLQKARTELKWSRTQLAEATELTVYTIAVIEQGKRSASPSESEALQRVLLEQLNRVLEESGEHPAVDLESPSDTNHSAAWNGVRRGDEVRVIGEKGRFHFLFHYRDERQEYVQVFGPIPGSVPRSRKPRAPHERSVRPERIVK